MRRGSRNRGTRNRGTRNSFFFFVVILTGSLSSSVGGPKTMSNESQ